jgi:hypothetical protein
MGQHIYSNLCATQIQRCVQCDGIEHSEISIRIPNLAVSEPQRFGISPAQLKINIHSSHAPRHPPPTEFSTAASRVSFSNNTEHAFRKTFVGLRSRSCSVLGMCAAFVGDVCDRKGLCSFGGGVFPLRAGGIVTCGHRIPNPTHQWPKKTQKNSSRKAGGSFHLYGFT